jgi:hypothetical protein
MTGANLLITYPGLSIIIYCASFLCGNAIFITQSLIRLRNLSNISSIIGTNPYLCFTTVYHRLMCLYTCMMFTVWYVAHMLNLCISSVYANEAIRRSK